MTSAAAATDLFPFAARSDGHAPGFTLRDGLQLVFKHGGLILACTVLVTALVWAGAAVQPKVYEGAARLWIKTEQQPMPSFLSGIASYRDQTAPDPINRKIETEMELLLARDSAQRVVERLQLRPEQLRRAPMEAVAERLRALTGRGPKVPTAEEALARQQALVDEFLKSFSVEPQRSKGADTSSNVIEIRFTAADAALVPVAIQAMVQEYIQLAARQNRSLGQATFSLLEAKADEARADLARSEQALLGFMSAQGDRTSRTAPRLASAEAGEGMPGNTSVVGVMKSQAADLQRRLDDLRALYTEEAANVRALGSTIGSLQQRIKREVRANAEADAQLGMLERQRALAQDRYVELQKRLDQIDLYLKVNPTEAESRVITQSPARPLKPETKKLLLVRLLGPLGGLLLGFALAGLREMFDRRLQSPDDASRSLGLEVLAALPELPQRTRPVRAVRPARANDAGGPESSGLGPTTTAEAAALGYHGDHSRARQPRTVLRELMPVVDTRVASDRSLLMHRLAQRVRETLAERCARGQLPQGLGRVLVVTSSRGGEGKSVIARALARRLALQGRGNVLLVDGSAEAPAGHGGDRVRGRPGFFDILREREVMAEVVGSRDLPRLQTLGTGFEPEAGLLYHEAAVRELFDKMRERYDWTIVDAGTLPHLGALSALSDGVLLVVDAQRTRREVVRGALATARVPAGRLIGTVLNRRPQYVPGWLYRGLL